MKRASPILLASILLALLPGSASANIPVPGGFGFLAPFWLSWKTMGLVLGGIVFLESAVMHWIARVDWETSFLVALLANAVSSIFGLLLGSHGIFVVSLLVLAVIGVTRSRWPEHWRKVWAAAMWSYGLAFITLIISFPLAAEAPAVAIFGSLVPAYFITVLIELPLWSKHISERSLRSVFLANGTSYLFLVVVLAMARISAIETPLMTPDFYGTHARVAAGAGKIDTMSRQLEYARSVGASPSIGMWFIRSPLPPERRYENYYPWADEQVARHLMYNKDYAEARKVLREALNLPGLREEWADNLEKMLQECEQKIFPMPSSGPASSLPVR